MEGGVYSSSGLIEPPKRQIFRLQIPYSLRFAIIWTVFFIIIGVGLQYYNSMNQEFPVTFSEVFRAFFTTEYANWFRSFGGFVDVTLYGSTLDVFYSIIKHWYYFFYTGGLLALIWAVLSWIINFELILKKKPKFEKLMEESEQQKFQLYHNLKINELLLETRRLIAQGKLEEAREKYNDARANYDVSQDPEKKIKAEAIEIYNEILKKEKEEANKKLR